MGIFKKWDSNVYFHIYSYMYVFVILGHCLASSSSPSVIIRAGSSENSRGGGRMSMVMVITRGMMTSVTTRMPQFGIEALCWILLPITVLLAR